jgi:putative DNA primase/helicase
MTGENTIAHRFVDENIERLRFDHSVGHWYRFSNSHWVIDETRATFHQIRLFIQDNAQKKPTTKLIYAVETLCRADPQMAVTAAIWNRDHHLIATPEAICDLRTGELKPTDPNSFINRCITVSPNWQATCPKWINFLNEFTGGNDETIIYLQRLCGYSLTGETREQILPFLYGSGGNGKSIFLDMLRAIAGSYAATASASVFTEAGAKYHPTNLASLAASRLVIASETGEGETWNEQRIKSLTGGEPITARFMRQDPFSFVPTFKIVMSSNWKPTIRNVDPAIERRLHLVPCAFKPTRPNLNLKADLLRELDAITAWAITGAIEWHLNGLTAPPVIAAATSDYLNSQDVIGGWLDAACEQSPTYAEPTSHLFVSFDKYCAANGERAGTAKRLSEALQKRGFELVKNMPGYYGKRGFTGVRLKPSDQSDRVQEAYR